ncbi:MAG: hypothetical protein KDK36_09255, partial [Leptospiraceae bacterium]|nr:hypothetical protein [Leptospiraceae bacterium]
MSKRDSLNTYLEEEIEVDGKICEIIYSCKPNHQIKDYIFIIPGNPGIAKYYIELLLLLKKELSNYSIIIIGYAGFTLKNRKVALTIEEEATHKKEVILNILNEIPEDSKINIIGHSVGGLVIRRI